MHSFIYKISIFIHVICGVLSLISGLVAMFARKKGGKVHNLSGLIFYYSMLIILVTSLIFFVLDPTNLKYQFFLGIAIISFYPTFSGKRLLKMKKAIKPLWYDLAAMWLVGLCGIVMVGYAVMVNSGGYQILFGVFGGLCLANFYGDWRIFTGRIATHKMHWFLGHAGKMIGAYSAAITAFCVNIVPRYMPNGTPSFVFIATWILPGVVFGGFSYYVIKKYRKKFNTKPVV